MSLIRLLLVEKGESMNRRYFVKAAALVPLAPLAAGSSRLSFASAAPEETGKDVWPGDADAPLRMRYELTLRRVLSGDAPAYSEAFLLADVRPKAERRFTDYSGDLSGRYIGALATAARVYGTPFAVLDSLTGNAIELQKPDGYFGATFHYDKPTDLDLALLWGNGRLLVGLLEYYELKPSPRVLTACRRLGDWLVRIGPLMLSKEIRGEFGAQHFASSYICWMQQTEGLANLYRVTQDGRYRKLAAAIAAVIERRPSDHVHGYLTGVRGVMDLYRATGEKRFLAQCEDAWTEVARSEDALIAGGVPEGWSPNEHRTEGCAEADWVRLSLALWKATGRVKYLAMVERAVFNELAFNQYATGDFGHRVYTETGLPAAGAVRAWWCCTLHGLRAFPDIQTSAFRAQEGGLCYDLPVDGWMETTGLSAMAKSTLAVDGVIRIKITAAGQEAAPFRIRRPDWASAVEIRVNGRAVPFVEERGYAHFQRTWKAGDGLAVKYAMSLRSEAGGKDRVSYFYGPWLLGAPLAENPMYFNELTPDNRLVRGKEEALAAGSQPGGPFRVPIAATKIPYVPAEYWDQDGSATLRAIAEQTGQPTTAWELRFLARKRG